ncbi:MAG TPA: MOSC domain-containing protein [Verrucomicrobiae bacterium]|nr:MOSC domain-containing protein [Verrucomicrobiae bacterium]
MEPQFSASGPLLGTVLEIFIASAAMAKMMSRPTVRALPRKGLEGDRYFFGRGTFSPKPQKTDFELTLIEDEKIAAFAAKSGIAFSGTDARRNVVTKGVNLNELVGQEFYLGKVRIRGIRLCEPCAHLASLSVPAILKGLVHQGGLRAQILSEGQIRVGDEIRLAVAPDS